MIFKGDYMMKKKYRKTDGRSDHFIGEPVDLTIDELNNTPENVYYQYIGVSDVDEETKTPIVKSVANTKVKTKVKPHDEDIFS